MYLPPPLPQAKLSIRHTMYDPPLDKPPVIVDQDTFICVHAMRASFTVYSRLQLRSKIAYCVDFHASIEITVSAHGNYSCTFVF